jgi:sugar porter (SP) family MFS transporter
MIAPTYVAENAPRGIRGLLVGFYQLFETMGAMVAFFINYGSLLHLKGHATWIVPLSMQSLPPFLLLVSIILCPESPRWLASKDDWDGASSVLSKVRNLPVTHPYVQAELLEMKTQLDAEKSRLAGNSYWSLTKEAWTIPGNRRRSILVIVLMIAQQMSGTNAINYYAPTIFTALGVTGNTNSLFATGIYGVVKVVSCGIFITFLADTLGRRWSLTWTGIFMGFCMFYLGFYVRFDPPVKGVPISGAGTAALVMVYLFASAFQFGWGPCCWIISSEIFSQRLRGLGVSYAAATQWLFNLVVARSTPVMLNTVGSHGYGTYFIYGCFCFTIGIGAFFLVPETKGVSLIHA